MDTKALRQKILDLAIRGKLVLQDPNDEPASVLLEKIRAEKQQMVKDGKLKAKDIKNDTIIFRGEDNLHYEKFQDGTVKCIEDEIPFEVPEGWSWCRLADCCSKEIKRGKSPKYSDTGNALVFAQKCNTKYDGINIDLALHLDESTLNKYPNDEYMQNGDTVINSTGTGTLGRVGIYRQSDNKKNTPIVPDSHVTVIRTYHCINSDYIYYYLKSYQGELEKMGEGSTNQKELKPLTLKQLLLPLPPLEEQKVIINKINEAMGFITSIESGKISLQDIIKQTKSKILDLAIRGKLVPQDPNDEPASVLLERIHAEKEELIKQGKIKRDKKESIIFRGDDNSYYQNNGNETVDIGDELPFDIPDSWCWGRLKDIVIINPRNKLDDDMEVSFVPMPLIENGYSGNHTFEIRRWKDIKSGFTHFMEGDIGVAKITPCFENRKSVVFKNLCNGYGAGTTELHILRPYKDTVLPEYLLAYVKTDQFIENGKQTFSGAVGQQRIGKEYIETVYFPIPPLQEQQRIIKQVNNLFSYLNIMSNALS